ncbi:ATP-binding protein [Haloarcula sp. Atlit-47R]|uniref:ATP-binding protein n=1 Tax=Haloarcula sp. Atlit-47R TaxID=2282132 RepID=UPI000EF2748E|nr:ATP-binding protein [Haloarcula sp. Atlit-47R]RLM47469.1 ATP-binding protein [Haloarcula sp. Atlit-47R]
MARVLCFGRAGTGKSWWCGWLIERVARDFTYAIHVDLEDEEIGLSVEGGLYTTLYVDEDMFNSDTFRTSLKTVLKEHRYIRVVPEGLNEEELTELTSRLADVAMKIGENTDDDTGIFFSVDEAHQVAREGKLDDRLNRLATGSRKQIVEWLFATQRPQLIDKTVLTQADYLACFEVKDRDMGKIQNSVSYPVNPANPDDFPAEDASGLDSLGKRRFMFESMDSGAYACIDTNTLTRHHPHMAGDDGIANEVLDGLLEDSE